MTNKPLMPLEELLKLLKEHPQIAHINYVLASEIPSMELDMSKPPIWHVTPDKDDDGTNE